MFYLGFMLGTAFGIALVAMLGANKPDESEYDTRSYDDGYDKGYKDGMSDGYTLKR